jgi:hypothetical protein
MKVIPRAAWAIAVALTVVVASGLLLFHIAVYRHNVASQPVEDGMHMGYLSALQFVFYFIMLATLFTYILLLGYVAGDARRRGMRPALWVLLAIFVPSAIGFLLYFILREPLLHVCPRCGARAKSSFPFCPSCGASLASACPSCKNAVEPGWSHCARCGTQLPAAQTL